MPSVASDVKFSVTSKSASMARSKVSVTSVAPPFSEKDADATEIDTCGFAGPEPPPPLTPTPSNATAANPGVLYDALADCAASGEMVPTAEK